MNTDLQLGKTWGLRRMANADGCFTMVALDQRPPIANLVADRRGIAPTEVAFSDMKTVKRLLVEELGGRASAMLLDPNFAFPAAIEWLPPRTGLLVTLEDHRFRDTPDGRLSHSIGDWNVEKIKRVGGDGVKVLAWYRPDAGGEVNRHQRDFVRRIGEDCKRFDIPYVLELLVYPFPKGAANAVDYVEAPEKLPELVLESVREFARPEYGVDLFKLESPLPGATLPDPDGSARHRQAQRCFDELGALCRQARQGRGIPWVMLSAGVTSTQFHRVMQYAYAGGANGFLAGRAIWWDALQAFPDVEACRKRLGEQGVNTLEELVSLTRLAGKRWLPTYDGLAKLQAEGEFCASYP